MAEKTILSLDPYIRIHNGKSFSFGGNQMWFAKDRSFYDRTRHMGGCGLVAVCDFMLWYCLKNRLVPKNFPPSFLNGGDCMLEKEEYLTFLRHVSTHGYPILPKLGSFSFEMAGFVNHFLASVGAKERIRFLWQNNPKKRLKLAEDSVRRGYPCMLIIGPHFLSPGQRGVNFYRMSPDGKLHLAHRDVHGHFVMLTGICRYDDLKKPVLFEISSWGEKYYISSEEYTQYIRKRSSPIVCGMFTLN